ncbi:MAG: hypothetical protein JWP36_303 [Paucimonas sp.]|nr:hypothetical protein [Paucimonas sp.]
MVEAALQGLEFPLEFVHSLEDARRLAERATHRLAMGTLQFDESRLFDLLPITQAAGTPLIALKLTESHLPPSVVDAFFRAAELMGFAGWMDVHKMKQVHGWIKAHAALRRLIVETALPG